MPTKRPQALFIPAPKLNQLQIMKEIAGDANITQAALAHRCALSVAMVNNYMRELSAAGFLEYHRKSSKSISYHLTQAGREAAWEARHELILELVRLFSEAKKEIQRLIFSHAGNRIRRVVLYGSGELAELAFHALESAEVDIVGVCDEATAKTGRDWCGREVLNPSQIRFIAPDCVIIADPVRGEAIHSNLSYLLDRDIRLIRLDRDGIPQHPQQSKMIIAREETSAPPPREEAV